LKSHLRTSEELRINIQSIPDVLSSLANLFLL
jgi:hypothetical protein